MAKLPKPQLLSWNSPLRRLHEGLGPPRDLLSKGSLVRLGHSQSLESWIPAPAEQHCLSSLIILRAVLVITPV